MGQVGSQNERLVSSGFVAMKPKSSFCTITASLHILYVKAAIRFFASGEASLLAYKSLFSSSFSQVQKVQKITNS